MPILAKVKLIMAKEFTGDTKVVGWHGPRRRAASLKPGAATSDADLSCE